MVAQILNILIFMARLVSTFSNSQTDVFLKMAFQILLLGEAVLIETMEKK